MPEKESQFRFEPRVDQETDDAFVFELGNGEKVELEKEKAARALLNEIISKDE